MGRMGEGLAQGVEDSLEADLGTEMFAIPGNGLERLGRGLEENAVDHLLVLVGNRRDCWRQRQDYMKVINRQQISLTRFQPCTRCRTLARRAMPIPAA